MDSRTRLVKAVDEVLREVGPGALSLRAVARSAGVSHNLPGVLFGDRSGLLTAYAASAFVALGAAMREGIAAAPEGGSLLAASGQAYVAFALDHPTRFELMFRQDELNAEDPDYIAACAEGFAPLAEVVRGMVGAGELGADEARDVGTAAWAMVHGLAMLQLGGHMPARSRGEPPEALTERVTALFAARMRAPAPAEPVQQRALPED